MLQSIFLSGLSSLRLFCVLLPALTAFILTYRAIFRADLSDIRYALWLIVIFAATLLIPVDGGAVRRNLRGERAWRLAMIALPAVLIYPLTVVVLIFGQTDMAAFVFHLVFGMDGTPWSDFAPYLFTAAVYWIVFTWSVMRASAWLDQLRLSWAVIGCGVLVINPLVWDLAFNRVQAAYAAQPSLVSEYHTPAVVMPETRPNLILIYLEGYERTYFDTARFGDLLPELRALEAEALSFTNVDQAEATGWSLAGNVATQCGVPMLPLGARPLNRFSEVKKIVPSKICLGDVLSDAGYHLTYMSTTRIIGNEMGYYGFDNFVKTHGYDLILDRDSFEVPRAAAFAGGDPNAWGLFDSELFDFATDHIIEMDRKGEPFAVTIATMDTHGPVAQISPFCAGDPNGAQSEDMRDAISCVSRMIPHLIARLGEEVDLSTYRFAVMSDHFAHRNNLSGALAEGARRNFVMLYGGPDAPAVIDRPGTMLDVYPTILHWLGFLPDTAPRAGLGASLLGEAPTLAEVYGVDALNARLKVDVELAQFIWR